MFCICSINNDIVWCFLLKDLSVVLQCWLSAAAVEYMSTACAFLQGDNQSEKYGPSVVLFPFLLSVLHNRSQIKM